jgi:hypothetical protein
LRWASTGTLKIDNSSAFNGTITGQLAIGDVIDLTDITAGPSATILHQLFAHAVAPGEPSGQRQPDPIPQEDDRVPVHQPPAGRRGDSRFRGPAHATGGFVRGASDRRAQSSALSVAFSFDRSGEVTNLVEVPGGAWGDGGIYRGSAPQKPGPHRMAGEYRGNGMRGGKPQVSKGLRCVVSSEVAPDPRRDPGVGYQIAGLACRRFGV